MDMGSQLRDSPPSVHSVQIDPVEFGKISQNIETLTGEVRNMREDFKELREDIRRKPDMSDVERKLQDYGFDDPAECKKDQKYLHEQRLKAEKHDVIKQRVVIALFTAATLAIGAWTWNAVTNQITDDVVKQEQRQ